MMQEVEMRGVKVLSGVYTTPTLYAKHQGLSRGWVVEMARKQKIPAVKVGNQYLIWLRGLSVSE